MSIAAWVIIIVLAGFVGLAIFCAGHYIGYNKGERDILERLDYYTKQNW